MGAHNSPAFWRRTRSIATAGLLIAAGLVWTAGPVQAAAPCPIPGNFEIDGDMLQATCTPAGDDWNTPGLGVQSTSQGGTYSTAGKDDGNPATWVSTGSTPNKTDFERAYVATRVTDVGGTPHYFVYVAWERTATTGTQGYAIEIDNAGSNVADDGTPQPDRSQGGYVFYISAQGGGLPSFAGDCTFTSQADYGSSCSNSVAGFDGAFNTSAITDTFTNLSVAAGGFDEVSLDVTTLTGIAPSCPGPSAASLYLRSITGQTANGNLKGYLEPFDIAPNSTCVPPPITTTATPGGALNPPGSGQHDDVTVGTAQAPGVGSVKFYLCSPPEVTANAGDCSANGTLVSTNPLDANGQASSSTVNGSTTPNDTALGTYCWRAEFTPSADDHNYIAGSHTNSTTECFTVAHASPTIATQIAVTGTNSPGLGFTTLGDTATLSGFIGSVTGETITFKLYGPYGVGVTPTCANDANNPVFTTTGTLNAAGVATTSTTYDPTAAGTYVWIASYPGNTLNDPIAGTCTDAHESVTIVGAHIDVTKSANPPGPVSAGQTIGFDITVSNSGAVPATGVSVTDNLPKADGDGTGDLNWSIVPDYTGCSITGAVGSQVLSCPDLGTLAGSSSLPVIHVQSATTAVDCGVVSNKATVATTNGTGGDSDVATVSVLCPNLSLTKQADAATVSAGTSIGFTVTASNSGAQGTGSAAGVTIGDPLPSGSGVSWSIASQTGTACTIDVVNSVQVLNCTIGTLAAGATYTVHITSGTAFASCKAYPNTATLHATNAPTLTASDTTAVLCPSLSLTKQADAAAVNAGTQIGFTITASNAGPGTATVAAISDPLPSGSGVNWSIASQTGTACTIDLVNNVQILNCAIGTLGPAGTYTVHVVSGTSFASCKAYPNVATLTATNAPQLTANDTTSVLCADIVIQKTADDVDPVNVGSDIGFTVTVTNNGDGAASGVDVEDPLPSGPGISWSIDSSTGPLTCSISGAVGSQTLSCTGDLAASGNADGNDVQTVHITSTTQWTGSGADEVNSCGTYDNTATVTWSNGPDATISSNQATETVICPDLAITKTPDADSVSAGDSIGFSVEVTNAGPGTATGVTIHDPLPSGSDVNWTIDSVTGALESACTINLVVDVQVLDCTFGDLAPDADIVVHVISGTTQNSCAGYDNTATLSATNEPDQSASASTSVLCPDVSLGKTADADSVNAGEQIGFTITASNSSTEGTGTAKGVIIEDPLPGSAGVDWSIESGPDNCSIVGVPQEQTLLCTAVDLAPGESETVHIVSDTTFLTCATFDNTATLTLSNGTAPDPASASTTVNCPTLSLTKTADNDSVRAGNQIGFTIMVSNGGPGTAAGATVSDPLPSGTDVSWSIDADGTTASGCTIDNVVGDQVLNCDLGDLASGAEVTIHLVSSTSDASCARYPNVAVLDSDNAPTLNAHATTRVTDCLGTAPQPPISTPPVAVTGAGPIGPELGLVVLLIGSGLVLLVAARRPRKQGRHA